MKILEVRSATEHQFRDKGYSSQPGYDPKSHRIRKPAAHERPVIAWDMEGISHDGAERPQSPVLFGCSADVSGALSGYRLSTQAMLEYLITIAERFPNAIHVGYAFKYDANMIIAGLSERHIIKLWKSGRVSFRFDQDYVWSIRWIPGKMFTVTKRWGQRRNTRAKTSITIYDYSSFFGTTFLEAAESILRSSLTDDDRDVIAHGKAERGKHSWTDLPEIRHYWECEIQLIKRTFETFRDVMDRAGFKLHEWYGPGALANYINATRKLRPHFAGAQITSGVMPHEVHQASKIAFSGGRFELFKAGRITGPISALDINSAYPFALSKIPSLHPDEGEWHHVSFSGPVRRDHIVRFGVYRIQFRCPDAAPIEYRPMPLFWRDNRGMISYPQMVHGWYWSPEAAMVAGMPGADIIEGWEWHSNERIFPWEFLQEMYDTRMRLGKKNLLSMPFKLGPNSLYGKYAQTVGWNQKEKLPPKSHALPVAGWTTSYCRAMLFAMIQSNPSAVIAVETDAIYMTGSPPTAGPYGTGLGQWSYDTYDEMIYLQSGMYQYKQDGEWKGIRSRGMNRGEFPHHAAEDYLNSLKGGEEWEALTLTTRPKFIGAGAAIASTEKLGDMMCSWRSQQKRLVLGDTGKRTHVRNACVACSDGISPGLSPHRLAIRSRSDGEVMSFPRSLPWEKKTTEEILEIRRQMKIQSSITS